MRPIVPLVERLSLATAPAVTSPEWTVIDVSTRPGGDFASPVQGIAGRFAKSIGSIPTPGAADPTLVPFNNNVTVKLVPFEMPRTGRPPNWPPSTVG
jgi:hypothetical protein